MALEFDNYRFYHIPKTGGNYVREVLKQSYPNRVLRERGHPHCGPLRFYGRNLHIPANSFCCVRDPRTWYESFYRYRVQNGWKLNHPLDLNCRASSFDEFMWKLIKLFDSGDAPGYVTSLYLRFVPFCDHIIHQENLTKEMTDLFDKWEIPMPPLPQKINTTNRKIDTHLSPRLRQSIREIEGDIMKLLGYV